MMKCGAPPDRVGVLLSVTFWVRRSRDPICTSVSILLSLMHSTQWKRLILLNMMHLIPRDILFNRITLGTGPQVPGKWLNNDLWVKKCTMDGFTHVTEA